MKPLHFVMVTTIFVLAIPSTPVRADGCTDDLTPYSDAVHGVQRFGFKYNGKAVIPARFEAIGKWTRSFCDGLALVKENGKWGFVDKRGYPAIPAQFDEARSFSHGIAAIHVPYGWNFIDREGKKLCAEPVFDFDPISERKMGVRYVDSQGKVTFGFVDLQCHALGTASYDDGGEFHLGIAPVQKGGIWSWVDAGGAPFAVELPLEKKPDFWAGFWEFRSRGHVGLRAENGELVLEPDYDGVSLFGGKVIGVRDAKDKWAYYDTNGREFLTDFRFVAVRGFSDGLAAASDSVPTTEHPNTWGFINPDGEWVIAPSYFQVIQDFVGGYAKVQYFDPAQGGALVQHWIDKNGQIVQR